MKKRPGVYGELWEQVRRLPCFWKRVDPTHACGIGVSQSRPISAHHMVPVSRGGKDADGLLPVCGLVHDWLEYAKSKHDPMWDQVEDVLGLNLKELSMAYVEADYSDMDLEF